MNNQDNINNKWKWELLFVLCVAILMRVVFYTGVFGSDEMTYNQSAFTMLQQNFGDASYIGAIRYGVNIPVALSFWAFGVSEFSANIWPMLCAILEVMVAFLIARRLFNSKVAFLSALLLATVPVHVHFSGRMAADSPLSLFIALSFYLFIVAEQQNSKYKYLLSGLCLGFTYWVKSTAIVLLAPVFLMYALTIRKLKVNWLFFMLGGAVLWFSHFIFMWLYHGDPFHLINSLLQATNRVSNIDYGQGPSFYMHKLFIDIKHLWLLGPLAVIGLIQSRNSLKDERKIILLWLLVIVSLLSVMPLRQNNYMLLFTLPLCVFAAIGINSIKWKNVKRLTVFVWLVFAIMLSGLKQQDIRNFVSNSKALHYFALEHKDKVIYGSQKAANIHSVLTLLETGALSENNIRVLQDENDFTAGFFISFDDQTQDELFSRKIKEKILKLGLCMHPQDDLVPTGYGVGKTILTSIQSLSALVLPSAVHTKINQKLNEYRSPKNMSLYWVDDICVE